MKQGDVVQLGRHRLLCGDAFNPEHVDALMQGVKPDMLYCDPPYGMRYGSTPHGMDGYGLRVRQKRDRHVEGDERDFDPRSITALFDTVAEQFWWGADYYAHLLPDRNRGGWFVWDKRGKESLDRGFGSSFELCWSRKRHKRDIARITWFGAFGMVAKEGDDKRYHPTQKPVRLAEWFLEKYSKPGAIILDLFGGSGSTLLACERLNRTCYMTEISRDYCEVIIGRYEQMTQQPRLLETIA